MCQVEPFGAVGGGFDALKRKMTQPLMYQINWELSQSGERYRLNLLAALPW
jgi:hypothetical protein